LENKTNILLVWFQRIKTIRINRNSLIFGLFLLISSILWLLNALNKDYVERLKYPVKFTNIPEEIQVQNRLPDYLYLEINGHGYDILSYKINYSKPPIRINLKKTQLRKKADGEFYLLGSDLGDIANSRLKGEVSLIRVLPDSIHFITKHAETIKLPVKADIEYSAAKQHMIISKPELTPDSIEIKGIPEKLEKLEYVTTEKKSFYNLTADTKRFVKIKSIPGVKMNPDRIQINITVEKYTEANIKVPVKIVNVPANYSATAIPGNATLNVQVPLSEFKSLGPEKFSIEADFKKIKNGKTELIIFKKPDNIQSIEITPKQVQIILKKSSQEE
jgi:YbbR domain-containing protein